MLKKYLFVWRVHEGYAYNEYMLISGRYAYNESLLYVARYSCTPRVLGTIPYVYVG